MQQGRRYHMSGICRTVTPYTPCVTETGLHGLVLAYKAVLRLYLILFRFYQLAVQHICQKRIVRRSVLQYIPVDSPWFLQMQCPQISMQTLIVDAVGIMLNKEGQDL